MVGATNEYTFTFACAFKPIVWTGVFITTTNSDPDKEGIIIDFSSGILQVIMKDEIGEINSYLKQSSATPTINLSVWHTLIISADTRFSNQMSCYINGINVPLVWLERIGVPILFDFPEATIGENSTFELIGDYGFMYLNNHYTDFSDKLERLKYFDIFGYPTDIKQEIALGNVPDPLVLMLMENQNDYGINSGTGGNFVTQGGYIAGEDIKAG